MKTLLSTSWVLILLFISGCKASSTVSLLSEKRVSSILIKEVTIFNGKDSTLIGPLDVLIQDGVIQKINKNISEDQASKMIDGQGKTLMPGLIDSHVHLSGSGAVPWNKVVANKTYNLSAYLYAGITTVYDLGGLSKSIEKLEKKVDKGKILGPNVYHTHIPITVKNSHPIPLTRLMLPWPLKNMVNNISPTIDHPDNASKLIKKYVSSGVDYVKISCDRIPHDSPEMTFEQMKALVDAAHAQKKKVFVHIGSPDNAINAVKAGADVLAHGIWRGKLTPAQADTIATSKIPIIYTIAGFHNICQIYEGKFQPNAIDKKLVNDQVLAPVTGTKGYDVHHQKVMNEFFKDALKHREFWKDNFKLLYERNATIVVGTDSNLPGTYAGSTYFQEMDILKEYGLTNYQLLKGATYLNAHLFLKSPDFGSIEEGKKANLLLLNGNPLKDIDWVKKPSHIIKSGNIIHHQN